MVLSVCLFDWRLSVQGYLTIYRVKRLLNPIVKSKAKSTCVYPDIDPNSFYSLHFQLSPYFKLINTVRFTILMRSITRVRRIVLQSVIFTASNLNTEPAAPPESRFQGPICKNIAQGMSLLETSAFKLCLMNETTFIYGCG